MGTSPPTRVPRRTSRRLAPATYELEQTSPIGRSSRPRLLFSPPSGTRMSRSWRAVDFELDVAAVSLDSQHTRLHPDV
ncbi:hypothetical protein EVAR_76486_1 [Eumeta japonica]|uniref:Uncharacterized protein n=1 Tax=Eumeta variegata TaxID=151549 RepID=A0A4C1T7C3_EUMVA|nr:hypothetical protein EVAR_76486_1 [Eumeta japonica]